MTSYRLRPLLIIATSSTNISLNLHLPWTSTITAHNSVCYNLRFSWTITYQKAMSSWISTSYSLPHTVQKVPSTKSTPPMTSYGLHPSFIIAKSLIITSFKLHLPWTSKISPQNSVCKNLHLSWTTRVQKADYVWISASHGLLYTVQKVSYNKSSPPMTSYRLEPLLIIATSSTNISLNLHLPWTSTITAHNSVCYNLRLSWTTTHQEAMYIWISTSYRRFYLLSLHLQWPPMDFTHC